MFNLAIAGAVFGLIFVAELPDKTAIASLVLGAKYRPSWVFTGVAAAFAVHVVIAVLAGSLIALLPRRPVEGAVGALFLVGAILLWRRGAGDEQEEARLSESAAEAGLGRVAAMSFGVIFLAEFGDLTQILCANLAARYHSPLSVGVGAVLALWAVALVAMLGGKTLMRVIPIAMIVRIAAVVMVILAGYSVYQAAHG
ncbi:MAG TPA: TMEM165/GDT1 family protein [Jatrophihabitantaceae bacterium]|nr:TMEM165/GDT1 family protein [Jatrophihabitantaceae bacterium]